MREGRRDESMGPGGACAISDAVYLFDMTEYRLHAQKEEQRGSYRELLMDLNVWLFFLLIIESAG